jgi:hypothetical protein
LSAGGRHAARHRAQRPRRLRPNYRRIAGAVAALAISMTAVLAALGVVPGRHHTPAGTAGTHAVITRDAASVHSSRQASRPRSTTAGPRALPADSGTGKRVVFDMSDQRVWLVDDADHVRSTYLVSGSLTDNLQPGRYSVYSRSRWAVGVDDSGVMQYFVRFAHGAHAAIGFHSIPTKDGHPLQTRSQLGTPQSHGCIRQWLPDAIRLWDFAPVGTEVVVTA